MGQIPSGPGDLVSSDGVVREGPQKNKKRRKRKNTQRKIVSPPP